MAVALTKTFPRLWSLDAGIAMVVTDLHGDWDAYRRYGYQIIAQKQLRLASGSHARPRETGRYLLFDTARPINRAADLLLDLRTVYSA